jgi:hypothetical protein
VSPESEISGLRTHDSEPETHDSGLFSAEAIAAHLEKISLELKSAADRAEGDWQATLKKVTSRLAELKGNHTRRKSWRIFGKTRRAD